MSIFLLSLFMTANSFADGKLKSCITILKQQEIKHFEHHSAVTLGEEQGKYLGFSSFLREGKIIPTLSFYNDSKSITFEIEAKNGEAKLKPLIVMPKAKGTFEGVDISRDGTKMFISSILNNGSWDGIEKGSTLTIYDAKTQEQIGQISDLHYFIPAAFKELPDGTLVTQNKESLVLTTYKIKNNKLIKILKIKTSEEIKGYKIDLHFMDENQFSVVLKLHSLSHVMFQKIDLKTGKRGEIVKSDERALTKLFKRFTQPNHFLSENGKWLNFVDYTDYQLVRIDLETGKVETSAKIDPSADYFYDELSQEYRARSDHGITKFDWQSGEIESRVGFQDSEKDYYKSFYMKHPTQNLALRFSTEKLYEPSGKYMLTIATPMLENGNGPQRLTAPKIDLWEMK